MALTSSEPNWSDADPDLIFNGTHSRLRKLAKKIKPGSSDINGPLAQFGSLDLKNWHCYEDPEKPFRGKNFRTQLLKDIVNEEIKKLDGLSLDRLMQGMRNSLAHGGVHPISPDQLREARNSYEADTPVYIKPDSEISTIYFVSAVDKGKGTFVIEAPVSEVEKFWTAWKNLLIKELGDDGLKELDDAA